VAPLGYTSLMAVMSYQVCERQLWLLRTNVVGQGTRILLKKINILSNL